MHYKFLDGKCKSYKKDIYAIKYNAEMRQITLYDGNILKTYNSITELGDALEHKTKSYRKVVWCYGLSELIMYVGEKHFDLVEKHSTKSTRVKYALMFQGDIIFKNLKEFYNSKSLDKIKELNHIDDSITNEVVITWLSAQKEIKRCKGKICTVPVTQTGYIRSKLEKQIQYNDFKLLNQSKTKEAYEIFAKCKNGSLSGINEQYINETKYVYSYDFKSFYPWIMCTQQFPNCRYYVEHNLSINDFFYRCNKYKLWIVTITFDYIRVKGELNCRDWLNFKNTKGAITITKLDYIILQNTYDYKIKSIDEFICFNHTEKLPEQVINFINEQYNIKETFEHNTDEYTDAKTTVNCIFGLFDTNPLKYNQEIDNYMANKLQYIIGIFTAAYGRYFLWDIMHEYNPIHWDTDGFKTVHNIDLTEYNLRRKMSDDSMLGQLICENELAELTVFGNKQYLLNDTLKLSGTNGELAMEYFNTILKRKPKAGDIIPGNYTNKVIWDKKNGGGPKNLPFTIGSKFKPN